MKNKVLPCNICLSVLDEPIYTSAQDLSITSLCKIWPVKTKVFFCKNCGHLQTLEETNSAEYYAEEYKILIESEEEDQIYEVRGEKKVYRTDHQIETFFSLVNLPKDAKILDFGCAKSSTLRKIAQLQPHVSPYLYDVSDMYLPFWKQFVKPENWAIGTTPKSWDNYFDIVTSFFSLEHAVDAQGAMKKIASLLRPNGILYAIVPNIFTNVADLIVVDHINHFTDTSIKCVLQAAGLDLRELKKDLHTGAYIIIAKKSKVGQIVLDKAEIDREEGVIKKLFSIWENAASRLTTFESKNAKGKRAAIYGSGFYGTFLSTCIKNMNAVECIIDQNPFLQGKKLLEKPVIPPEKLSKEIEVIYVGLNPKTAKRIIEGLPYWLDRKLDFFYIDESQND